MTSEVCMDKGVCKSWTARWPGSPRSAKMQAKRRMAKYSNCMLNALLVLEDSVSMWL